MGKAKGGEDTPRQDYNEQIINSLTSGVIALDCHEAVITANPAAGEHLHVAMDRLRPGAPFSTLPHARPFLEILREMQKTHRPVARREIFLTYEDGSQKEIGLSASVLEGPEAFNGAIFLFVDMTERRRLERAADLNQQLATIGELTAGVVHELRNPVSVIRGMAELLLRKLDPGDERRRTTETILDEAQHLEKSIHQFLGFARPFELEPVQCHAGDIVERALKLCRERAYDKGVKLEYTTEEDLPAIRADRDRMAQALANILVNAIEAVEADGRVSLRVHREGPQMVFEVLDNGPGIQVAPGEDLFKPFFTRKEDGTGLGLAIVHRIVAAHHGSVACGNIEGGGARFEVRIPIEGAGEW